MWKSTLGGILCRGGIAYGQIVEPEKMNTKLGMFICGSAATNAVKLEETGKGARVFINTELVPELDYIPSSAFQPRKSPIDFLIVDEFLWYRYPKEIKSKYDKYHLDKLGKSIILKRMAKAIVMLKHSPKYAWNASSIQGRLQLASTIDIISSEINSLDKNLDLNFECDAIIDTLEKHRNEKTQQRISKKYELIIENSFLKLN